MWELYFLRPEAVNALDDSDIKKILPRYTRIVNDDVISKFMIAKCIEFKPKTSENLWKVHSNLMKVFYETLKKIDEDKIKFKDLKKPKISLLDLKIKLTKEMMKSCELCERKCHVNRIKNEKGFCRVGKKCQVSSEFMHLGEEPHITPSHTIFFMGCTFHCQYCQNWSISQWFESGYDMKPEKLALIIETKRKEGSRNVNFVGGEPTPSLLCILKTLKFCNVNIPVIWNSNFYMSEKTMKILDGIVDMHLSDFKYGNNDCAMRLSKVSNYFDVCSRNHLITSKNTEITIRHLILPGHVKCCTKPLLNWIAKNIRDKCTVNLMDQYRPEYLAKNYPEINRKITREEFNEVANFAKTLKINYIT